jgi:soluble lytic murein transglycosylase-like protein
MSLLVVEKAWAPAAIALTTAGRDIALGIVILGRGTVGLTGIMTLAAALTLLGSDQAREQLMTAARAMTSSALEGSAIAVGEPRSGLETKAGRWSDWLSAKPSGAAEPAQEHVTRYLSRRYRVAENVVRRIVGEAFSTGREIGVEPMLILAVSAIESGLNPFAQSPVGAQGLMQIMTRVHSEKFVLHGGDHAALDPIANLRVGSEILRDLIRRGGSVERGLQLYVGAGNAADDGGYGARVLSEMARIKLAAAGEVREALSTSWRADNSAEGGRESRTLLPVTAEERSPTVDSVRREI